jgi:hypothetical protein
LHEPWHSTGLTSDPGSSWLIFRGQHASPATKHCFSALKRVQCVSKYSTIVNTHNSKSSKRQGPKAGRTQNGQSQTVLAGATRLKELGRRLGKYRDENYTQTSIYLPIELRNRVRAKLYEKGLEMSGLVEDMLRAWLTKQQ